MSALPHSYPIPQRQPDAGFDPELFRPARVARIAQTVGDRHQQKLVEILLRPELRPLSGGLTVDVADDLPVPFRLSRDRVVRLATESLSATATAAVLLRHAFELTALSPAAESAEDSRRLALRWLAARSAALYLAGFDDVQRETAARYLTPGLAACYRLLSGGDREGIEPGPLPEQLASPDLEILAELTNLEDMVSADGDDAVAQAAWSAFHSAAPLAAPAEQLLVSGGDPRIRLDRERGTNSYGGSPMPRPAVLSFSSSTVSTPSEPSFAAVERDRRSLIEHALYDDLDLVLRGEARRLRREIAAACGLDSAAAEDIILTASGTDAEYHALLLTGAGDPEETEGEILNVVVAPDETGSGVPLAAAGLHFADETAHGFPVAKGEPVAEIGAARIKTVPIAVRDENGRPRSLAAIDKTLEQLVRLGAMGGMRILLHLLDSSKTGLGAPSLTVVQRLRERFPDRLEVVVDACQMRASATALAGYLKRGFMVMVTGSKFFTGPPFAGALLVPPHLAGRGAALTTLPEGLRAYCSAQDFPSDWNLGRFAAGGANPGPLLRWRAALWEQRAFEAVPPDHRTGCLAKLGAAIREAMEESRWLKAVPAPLFDRRGLDDDGTWQDRQSIFPFAVRSGHSGPADQAFLTMTEARTLYRLLLTDLSYQTVPELSDEDRAVLARPCHLGQPVKVAQPGQADSGALRLCLSARLVSRTVLDPRYGPNPGARLDRAVRELRLALKKAELIAQHFDHLAT